MFIPDGIFFRAGKYIKSLNCIDGRRQRRWREGGFANELDIIDIEILAGRRVGFVPVIKTPGRAIRRRSVGIIEAELQPYREGKMLPAIRGRDWHTSDLDTITIPVIKIDRDGAVGRGVDVDPYVKAQGGVLGEVHFIGLIGIQIRIIPDAGRNKIADGEIGGSAVRAGGGVRGSVPR